MELQVEIVPLKEVGAVGPVAVVAAGAAGVEGVVSVPCSGDVTTS